MMAIAAVSTAMAAVAMGQAGSLLSSAGLLSAIAVARGVFVLGASPTDMGVVAGLVASAHGRNEYERV
jgi:hypothetical protein